MCEEKRKGPKPRIFVHTPSQLGAMNTQQLIANTEWGPEELYEDKCQNDRKRFTDADSKKMVKQSLEISKKEAEARKLKEEQMAHEEKKLVQVRK